MKLAFLMFWLLLGIGGRRFFDLNRDVALKRRLLPIFMIGMAVLFLVGAVFDSGRPAVLAGITPMLGVIVWLNIRATRFCDACGRTAMVRAGWKRPEFCSQCGAKLPTDRP
jgi:hypothetical protein